MRDRAHSRRLGTPADEAGSIVPRQPPASKLANLSRIDVRDHAFGLVSQQLGGRVTEHPPAGWLGPRTPSLREGPGSAAVSSGSPDPVAETGARRRGPCGRGKLAQFSLLQRSAVWWVAPLWPILSVAAVLLVVDQAVFKCPVQSPDSSCPDCGNQYTLLPRSQADGRLAHGCARGRDFTLRDREEQGDHDGS